MAKRMPFVLLAVIVCVVFLENYMSINVKEILYGISLSIKNAIMFILPFIIFSLLFKSAYTLSSSASKIIVFLIIAICLSNAFNVLLAGVIGIGVYSIDFSFISPDSLNSLSTSFQITFPQIIKNNIAMFGGLISGLVITKLNNNMADKISGFLDSFVKRCLPLIIFVMPVFVAGFMVKLVHDGALESIINDYMQVFLIIAVSQLVFIIVGYGLLSKLKINIWIYRLKNMLPAWISGVSTMSSAASMPLSIIGAEKNSNDPVIARSVIPATVNIHLVGDCLAIPVFAFAIMKSYGVQSPDIFGYIVFCMYFVIAKFSTAAVPGGGIIVMLPVLEKYMGFQGEMISLITALYILFDPIITGANIMGNGYFAILFEKIYKIFSDK